MSLYSQGPHQRLVGSVRRDRWEYFLESLGVNGNRSAKKSEIYNVKIDGRRIELRADFSHGPVYVSADALRGTIKQRIFDANSNSVKAEIEYS